MYEPEKEDIMTPCMYVYKENIKYYGSLDKSKFRTAVRGDFQNKEMIGDTWYPTASITTINNFLSYATKNKSRVH